MTPTQEQTIAAGITIGPAIPAATIAQLSHLSPEQKQSVRPTLLKAYGPVEVEKVFGPAPAPTPVVTVRANDSNLSPAQKAQGYVTLFKHATDRTAVIEAARRAGVNLTNEGVISDVPVAKESPTEPSKPLPNYHLQWRERPDLPIAKLTALDAQYRQAFGAVELSQPEATAAFDAIQDTMAIVPKDADRRAAYCRLEGQALEAAYGEQGAEELVRLHSDWFRRLPETMQQRLTDNYAMHSMRAIVTTANLQRAWLARRGRKA